MPGSDRDPGPASNSASFSFAQLASDPRLDLKSTAKELAALFDRANRSEPRRQGRG
jgi:hypothetical protein